MTAAKLLDDAEVKQVEESGFSTFLNLQLGTICERKETNLCMKLVDLEENRIKVQLQKDVIGYITPEEIYHLLRLPRGDKAPLKYNKQQQKDFAKLRAELGDPKMSLEIADILALMRREDKKHLRVKCFFLILFSKFLMPTTQQKINVNAVMYTQDLTSIKDYDFCAIVYEHLRDSIRTWKARTLNKSNKSMTMPGCIIIILGFIVYNLKLTEIVDKKCPRINQYTMETLMGAIGNAKCHHGMISFDNFKLKALEETCYAESSRFYIQSPVDSQHSAVVTSGVPPETQMPMQMQLLHQAHGLISAVQPVARSIGIDPEAVDECIAGLALQRAHGLLSAMQPLDLEKFSACIAGIAQSGAVNRGLARSDAGAVNRGLARSDAGASCSFSDGVFGNPTTEISGIAEDAEDAEAAKTKKATVHEEETNCSFSDGVNDNPTIRGIAEAARAAKTKKATGRAQKSAPRKNAAEVGSKNPAGENAAKTNPAPPTSRCTTRAMGRPSVLKHKGEVVKNYGALAGGDASSPAKPIKKQVKR